MGDIILQQIVLLFFYKDVIQIIITNYIINQQLQFEIQGKIEMNKSGSCFSLNVEKQIGKRQNQMNKIDSLKILKVREGEKKGKNLRNSQNYYFSVNMENCNTTKLFAALKMKNQNKKDHSQQKQQVFRIIPKHNHDTNNKIMLSHRRSKTHKYQQDLQLILRESSLRKIQLSKFQKINYIVEEHVKTGRAVKQILESDLMGQLEEQIKCILRTNKNNKKLYQQSTNSKVLPFAQQLYPQILEQSTTNKNQYSTAAQYEQQSYAKQNEKIEKQQIIQINQFQLKQTNQKINNKDTDNLQNISKDSPFFQNNSNIINQPIFNQQFNSFQKKQQNCSTNQQLSINIVQFTLGNKNDHCQNISQKQNQITIIQKKESVNYPNDLYPVKSSCIEEVSQFNQNTSKKISTTKPYKAFQMLRNRCKKKSVDEKIKKMPNGKAIKNRVMGRMGGG